MTKIGPNKISYISASRGTGIDTLKQKLIEESLREKQEMYSDTLITNTRHYENLMHIQSALQDTLEGIKHQLSGDLLASSIRSALHHLGEITGEVTTEDLLKTIFSKFCIGK